MNRQLVVLILLSLLAFFLNLGGPSIYILDEAKNAGCAMEMQQRNDWIVPTFNAELRTDKPPLHYYFMRAAYAVFGVTPFAARFFSAVMGLLLVIFVYAFVKRHSDKHTAFYTGLILLCSIQTCIQFRLAVPDPYLITFLTFALLLFYEGFQSGKTLPLMLSYGFLGLATLAKGPVALVFYGLIVLVFLISNRSFSWKEIVRLKVPVGMLLFAIAVLPWYILVGLKTDGLWLTQFFLKHNVGRFTSTMEGHRSFPLASFLVLVAALMPFSFYFPQMIRAVWKVRKQNQLLSLCLISMAVVTVFFAASRTLLPGYIAPAFPFFAIVLGYYWKNLISEGKPGRAAFFSAYCSILVSAAICFGLWKATQTELTWENLNNCWLYGLALLAGSIAATISFHLNSVRSAFTFYAAGWLVFIGLFFGLLFPAIDIHNPVSKSLPLLTSSTIACYKTLNPAFVFALQRPVQKLNTAGELENFLKQPNTRVITDLRTLKKTDSVAYSIIFQQKDLFERSTTVIIAGKDYPGSR